ncbi:DUF86 domain-containing protein [Methanohalophilus sp. RSK]|uniref:type VII toxin-antitoxin system HepT family RNase toxin n=1 Tax=Methanohalophilus sp. RSK TaxID=2485783 RepID=UPI000F439244|nr:DUF86 domain-containing protein [Methanohalophilus sp. RSK]RNI15739.1 DUF86 domain-containing protein [Methanohalophilus sp. RSK]
MNSTINSKLESLAEYIEILKGYQDCSIDDIAQDHTLRGAVERYLEVSLECMIDIGEMIFSRQSLKKPESYKEIFMILGDNGILPQDFSRKISPAADFRGELLHMYADIDMEKVYLSLQNHPDDLEKFARYINLYLKRRD